MKDGATCRDCYFFCLALFYRIFWTHSNLIDARKGYTKDYIDGKISHDSQLQAITNAYHDIASKNEVVLCEGTGEYMSDDVCMSVR